MREMIAGRILKVLKDQEGNETGEQKSVAEIMADVIFEAMEGKLILSSGKHGVTYVNPLHAVKLFHDYMLKARELSIRVRELKKEKGSGGGIRIVLPSVPADPLLKPGQKPRPLRLLGQDPSKPLPDPTGTATDAHPSPGPVPTHADGGSEQSLPGMACALKRSVSPPQSGWPSQQTSSQSLSANTQTTPP